MVLITEYDIGDKVDCGPIKDARILSIQFRQGITYGITYWDDNKAIDYTAYDWELKIVEKFNKDK
jgi:hypothetical protein